MITLHFGGYFERKKTAHISTGWSGFWIKVFRIKFYSSKEFSTFMKKFTAGRKVKCLKVNWLENIKLGSKKEIVNYFSCEAISASGWIKPWDLSLLINLWTKLYKGTLWLLFGWNLGLGALWTRPTDCNSSKMKKMKVISSNVNARLGL